MHKTLPGALWWIPGSPAVEDVVRGLFPTPSRKGLVLNPDWTMTGSSAIVMAWERGTEEDARGAVSPARGLPARHGLGEGHRGGSVSPARGSPRVKA